MPGLEVVHKERKNMGMTYIYILRVIKSDEDGANLSIKDREKMKKEQ